MRLLDFCQQKDPARIEIPLRNVHLECDRYGQGKHGANVHNRTYNCFCQFHFLNPLQDGTTDGHCWSLQERSLTLQLLHIDFKRSAGRLGH